MQVELKLQSSWSHRLNDLADRYVVEITLAVLTLLPAGYCAWSFYRDFQPVDPVKLTALKPGSCESRAAQQRLQYHEALTYGALATIESNCQVFGHDKHEEALALEQQKALQQRP
jgi:hypothetical protein